MDGEAGIGHIWRGHWNSLLPRARITDFGKRLPQVGRTRSAITSEERARVLTSTTNYGL